MPDADSFEIHTDLVVPRDDQSTSIPTAWINDLSFSLDAHGLLYAILSYAEPGRPATGAEIAATMHPDDPPLDGLLDELVVAGYLIPEGEGRYRLVHPDRFPPLPAPTGPKE